MRIAVFADAERRKLIEPIAESLKRRQVIQRMVLFDDYDDFIAELAESGSNLTIVAHSGAQGMESAKAAKILLPETPLVWLSEDKGFGAESYRIGCSYFSASPITEQMMLKMIEKIRKKEERL